MTPGSVDGAVLVLGLGNSLLGDDGAGLALLEELAAAPDPGVEYLDGGTQGLALLGRIAGRRALLIVDAVKTGAPPGTVHALRGAAAMQWLRGGATTAHESNAGELIAAAALLGVAPADIAIVGVEPERLEIGIGLTDDVRRALPEAVAQARSMIAEMAGDAVAP
ncbi:MAG TPA: hydrogenase maturation protease [Bryobacteraceae bacterium]|nr:hydrogenase maturation protease [Bryobacteraceae bacterium]